MGDLLIQLGEGKGEGEGESRAYDAVVNISDIEERACAGVQRAGHQVESS